MREERERSWMERVEKYCVTNHYHNKTTLGPFKTTKDNLRPSRTTHWIKVCCTVSDLRIGYDLGWVGVWSGEYGGPGISDQNWSILTILLYTNSGLFCICLFCICITYMDRLLRLALLDQIWSQDTSTHTTHRHRTHLVTPPIITRHI